MGKNRWVVPYDGKWGVKKEGADLCGSLHDTQAEGVI